MKILKATVLLREFGTDKVFLQTDLPSPMPLVKDQKMSLSFDTERKYGADYVREHFGIEPEIIDEGRG